LISKALISRGTEVTVYQNDFFSVDVDIDKNLVYFDEEYRGGTVCLNLAEFTEMIKAVSDAFKTGKA